MGLEVNQTESRDKWFKRALVAGSIAAGSLLIADAFIDFTPAENNIPPAAEVAGGLVAIAVGVLGSRAIRDL